MSRVKEQVYWSILKTILMTTAVFHILKAFLHGVSVDSVLFDSFYLLLIMFLRSTAAAATWMVGLKWTLLLSIPIESMVYGGGFISHLIAVVSFSKFLFNYGFVLHWNPVLRKKDTLPNRLVEIVMSSFVLAVLAPWKIQTFIVQVVLSIHAFWLQTKVVEDVCNSGVMDDMKAVISELPTEASLEKPPIEIWIVSYFSVLRRINVLPQEVIDAYIVPTSPWQLRRLIVKSLTVDPTRSQMKTLLTVASSQPVGGLRGGNSSKPTLLNRGPLALMSEETNEKVVVNEAIHALSKLLHTLGEKRFIGAFERSTDGKLAIEIVKAGYK